MIGDFTHFFDNRDHDYLKRQWCSLLKSDRLPDDHYSVFKNVTAYSKWELKDLLILNGFAMTGLVAKALIVKCSFLSNSFIFQNKSIWNCLQDLTNRSFTTSSGPTIPEINGDNGSCKELNRSTVFAL